MKINLIKPAFAQITNPVIKNSNSISQNPAGYVNSVIQAIISIFFIVGIIYFIWHIIMSAYHMISSNGDPKKYEEAQKSILYSFVGLIIVFAVFAILKFAGIIFGIPGLETLTLTWPSLSK
ncbi:MAG: pilin [Candidatus Shapirobacteria bacterium]|nr:pilin [Candidatus Shapirobacteria bacterium]